METKKKLKILFLCTGNSCRSQMAEALTKHLKADAIEAYSAGTAPKEIDPRAIKAMAEVGIDISTNRSKSTVEYMDMEFDYAITLCDNAQQACPFFPAKTRVVHHGFENPPVLAAGAKGEEEAMAHYRRIRDEIRAYVGTLPESLEKADS
jgi:arsenate reductase